MGANFPGSSGALPGAYAEVYTNSTASAVPGGQRTAVILGEGLRVERLISSAVGAGSDGLNSAYTSSNGSDGRHFQLGNYPIITNRTQLYKNGVLLTGIEEAISSTALSSRYEYRIETTTGKIELQAAALVDQGGAYYSASTSNEGTGTISNLTLEDPNAPTETWTVRCTSVRRDTLGVPVDGYAKFVAQGSVSGTLLDGYGNQIVWNSDGQTVSNTILSFAINEGATNFHEGDRFTIKVKGGALVKGDILTAYYIALADINDPEFFTSLSDLTVKHGAPSTTNRLSLGAQLAFANNPPGVWACQAAPAVPRRVSYTLKESATGNSAADDLEFILPTGVVPDSFSNINFFITNPVTGVESQIIPNKVDFFNATYTSNKGSFESGITHPYSYTVVMDPIYELIAQAEDGVLTADTPTTATISSSTYMFTSDDASATRKVKILTPDANAGTYAVASVSNGEVHLSGGSFTNSTSVKFEVLDSSDQSAVILFTQDLAPSAGSTIRATIVDAKDADFFDVSWTAALEAIETIDVDIVVPLPSQTISNIFATAMSHCTTMSQTKMRKERVLLIGATNGLLPDNVLGNSPAAVEDIGVLEGIQGDTVSEILTGDTEDLTDYTISTAYGNTFRVVYCYPDQIVVQIGADRTILDGFFAAAALGGWLSGSTNIAVPVTNKVLAGFTILRDRTYRPIIQENLVNAGAMLMVPVAGGAKVLWGRTSTISLFPEEQEISIVFIRDRIAKDMRAAFAEFVGQAESPSLQGSLQARANKMVQSFLGRGLITAFKDLSVSRDKVDPRQWNVAVQVQPTYGVNYIYIPVGIGAF